MRRCIKQGENLGLLQVQDDANLPCALFMLSTFCVCQRVAMVMDVALLSQVCNNGGQHHNNGYFNFPVIDVLLSTCVKYLILIRPFSALVTF